MKNIGIRSCEVAEHVGVVDCRNNCAEMSRESSVEVVMLKERKEGGSEQKSDESEERREDVE